MKKLKILLILIFLLAAFLRFYKLGEVPPSLHSDEAVFGYNAYSFLKTGKDEYGHQPSLVLKAFEDFRPSLYTYFLIPSVAALGLNEYAVRLPSALFSLLTVVLFYFLVQKISQNKEISIYSTFLLACSFWHLNLSREGVEKIAALFLVLLGLFFFYLFIEKNKRRDLIFAFLLWFLSIHTYYFPRFFLPLFLIFFFFFYRKKIFKKQDFLPLGLALLLLASIFYFSLFSQGSLVRLGQLSIFSHPEVKLVLEEQIREESPGTNLFLVRLFHNKAVNYCLAVLEKYGKYFSFDFLIFKGGEPLRVAVPNTGLLSLLELPFFLAGIYFLLREKREWGRLLFFWILIAPLPGSLTVDETPNVYRSLMMLPALNVTTALGFVKIKSLLMKTRKELILPFWLIIGVFFSWNFFYYLHQYYVHQRFHRPWHRQYGYKQLVYSIKELYPDYDKILVTKAHSSPYIFFLFYQQYDPALYQSWGSPRDLDFSGFDKYIFIPHDCPSHVPEDVIGSKKTLFIDKGECKIKPYGELLKTIYREDKTPVFHLIKTDEEKAAEFFKKQEKLEIKELISE